MYQQQVNQIIQAVSQPRIYNDARDQILGNFNKIQAFWGTGKAYYSRDAPPVELTESFPTQRFKAISYAQIPMQDVSEKLVEEYLNKVPDGIDPKVWDQAKQNNPDPKKFVPIPLIGFQALNERFKMQQFETQQQRARLRQLSEQVTEMQKHVAAMKSKLEECRRKKVILGNRVLKVLIMQEIENRRGFPIQADEEKLRSRMENILSELHAQTKYKGCLNELMSQLKQVQNQQHRSSNVHLDDAVVEDIKDHLKNELKGIEHLIKIIHQDNEIISHANSQYNNPPAVQGL